MKTGDRIKVWNHTFSGKLIEEGTATLRRKDPHFRGETIPELGNQVPPFGLAIVGPFERWMVTFEDDPKNPVSRWVRGEDLEDPFAAANARLARTAKALSKVL